MGNKKSLRSDLSALDSWFEHDEALGYRLTFVRSENSVADSNSLISDSRVHIVYKLCRRLKSLKTEFKRTAAARTGFYEIFFKTLQRLPKASGWLHKPYRMIILIIWDMFETYSNPWIRWKSFYDIGFSKLSAWKWVKIQFLAYCVFIKAFTACIC